MEREPRITTLSTRRPKWQYPPAPTPRILHLPRRHHRKRQPQPSYQQQLKFYALKRLSSLREKKGKLATLFDQERVFAREGGEDRSKGEEKEEKRRERVEEEERECVVFEEEKWRFQAEMLRAECNLLKMEREIAVKKMERRRVQMDKALRSAVRILVSGQQRIHDGKNAATRLVEEIQELVEKMEKLQRRLRAKDLGMRSCSNFDRQVSHLQRRLDKFQIEPEEICVEEIQEMAEASLFIKATCTVEESFVSNGNCNMEILRREMEKLSKGSLLERIKDEYGSLLSTDNNSATSSASISKRIEYVDAPPTSTAQQPFKEMGPLDEKACSGCCKAIVRKVVEQVRAETEQWSQMQEMLVQVREEMDELQASREFWEDRALDSDCQLRCLRSSVEEWKRKALHSESKANDLESQVSVLDKELQLMRRKIAVQTTSIKNPPVHSRDTPSEMEKRVLVCRVKENHHHTNDNGSKQKEMFCEARRKALSCSNGLEARKRLPLREVENLSPLIRQNGRSAFYLHCPLPSSAQENI